MYSPEIKPYQVQQLYRQAQAEKRPMTKLVEDAINTYLEEKGSHSANNDQALAAKQAGAKAAEHGS